MSKLKNEALLKACEDFSGQDEDGFQPSHSGCFRLGFSAGWEEALKKVYEILKQRSDGLVIIGYMRGIFENEK